MLFILTGFVQTGKSRWLEQAVKQFTDQGVAVSGVLAPGIWRERTEMEDVENVSRFEKLGIRNILLPSGEDLVFAQRAKANYGMPQRVKSQSAQAKLSWDISEDALNRVNNHFKDLRGKKQDDFSLERVGSPELLVIDEIGRLELLRNGGLVEALSLLDQGTSSVFPHALIVVRESLLEIAKERFAEPWGGCEALVPGDDALNKLTNCFSCQS